MCKIHIIIYNIKFSFNNRNNNKKKKNPIIIDLDNIVLIFNGFV